MKFAQVCNGLPWRQPIASLNLILASNVWQQDHNGFTHQDPGFLDHIANKKADVVRLYLPPDANCLLSCFDHCIKSRNYVNVIVASKHPRPQWLTLREFRPRCDELSLREFHPRCDEVPRKVRNLMRCFAPFLNSQFSIFNSQLFHRLTGMLCSCKCSFTSPTVSSR